MGKAIWAGCLGKQVLTKVCTLICSQPAHPLADTFGMLIPLTCIPTATFTLRCPLFPLNLVSLHRMF